MGKHRKALRRNDQPSAHLKRRRLWLNRAVFHVVWVPCCKGTQMASASSEFIKNLKFWRSTFVRDVANAQYVETELLSTQVKYRTPVDTGTLRSTVHAEGPFFRGNSIETRIVAGGPSAAYALFVHEMVWLHHKVGQAKFIESVLDENAFTMLGRIAIRVAQAKGVPAAGGGANGGGV